MAARGQRLRGAETDQQCPHQTWSLCRRHQPDLVLLDPAWPLGLLGPQLSRPYGVILHGAEVTIPGRIPLVASSLRYVLKNASVTIAAGSYPEGEAIRNAAERLGPVIQIPPGVDTSRFTPLSDAARASARSEFGFGDDEFVIASYSRLVPRKGMDTLIRASAQLHEAYPKFVSSSAGVVGIVLDSTASFRN